MGGNRIKRIIPSWQWLLLLPVLFLAIFFFFPLGSILDVSLRPDGVWDWSGFTKIISSPYYRNTLLFTVWQALWSTLLTIGLAVPSAYVFVRYQFWGKSFLLSIATVPFVLPTVVVAVAFSALIGSGGLINELLVSMFQLEQAPIQLERTLAIILIVHVFYNYSIALRMIHGYWVNQGTQVQEAAEILGCSGWRMWREIHLPLLRPIILAASVLVFIFTFTSFGVVLILGGIEFATVEVQIYVQVVNLLNLPLGAALSLVQIGMMFVMMMIYTRLQQQVPTQIQANANTARRPRTWQERLAVRGTVGFMVVFLFIPLITLVWRSISIGGDLSLEYFSALNENTRRSILFTPPTVAIGNSLVFALLTSVLAVGFGLLIVYLLERSDKRLSRWLDPLFMLPLATSAVVLGFGFIIALDEPPLNLRSSWVLIPIAHTLVAIPFVVRSLLPAMRRIPSSLRESAQILGAGQTQIFRWIELPLIWRGLVVGGMFAFTISIGEFGASLFIARPDTPTMPVVIYRLFSQPGTANYGQAVAMSVILMMVCLVGFLVIERVRFIGMGEF